MPLFLNSVFIGSQETQVFYASWYRVLLSCSWSVLSSKTALIGSSRLGLIKVSGGIDFFLKFDVQKFHYFFLNYVSMIKFYIKPLQL